ncbi:hypothetical protein MTO96_027267 [Rhipicephalus appendiculatus]
MSILSKTGSCGPADFEDPTIALSTSSSSQVLEHKGYFMNNIAHFTGSYRFCSVYNELEPFREEKIRPAVAACVRCLQSNLCSYIIEIMSDVHVGATLKIRAPTSASNSIALHRRNHANVVRRTQQI